MLETGMSPEEQELKRQELLENYDEKTMKLAMETIANALIGENNAMTKVMDSNIDKFKVLEAELDSIGKSVEENKKELENQTALYNSLKAAIDNSNGNEAVQQALQPQLDEITEKISECVDNSNEYIGRTQSVKHEMDILRNTNNYLKIASETLINFGLNYGLLQKIEEKEEPQQEE